jgi:hypothetical protein
LLTAALGKGRLSLPVATARPLADAAAALRDAVAGQAAGATVLTLDVDSGP